MTRSGRPHLRVISSTRRTLTVAREDVDEAAIEDRVRRDEARTHVAHLRLLAKQLGLWDPDTSARMLLRLAAGYERKWQDSDGEAA